MVSVRRAAIKVKAALNDSVSVSAIGGLLMGSAGAVASVRPALDLFSSIMRQAPKQSIAADAAFLSADILIMFGGLRLVRRAGEIQDSQKAL